MTGRDSDVICSRFGVQFRTTCMTTWPTVSKSLRLGRSPRDLDGPHSDPEDDFFSDEIDSVPVASAQARALGLPRHDSERAENGPPEPDADPDAD